jgi:hypothetical protein
MSKKTAEAAAADAAEAASQALVAVEGEVQQYRVWLKRPGDLDGHMLSPKHNPVTVTEAGKAELERQGAVDRAEGI